jgi:hypothetical protein
MGSEITLVLPEKLYQSAERLAAATRQPVPGSITDVLTEALIAWGEPEPPLSSLSDEQIVDLSEMQMADDQSQRLSLLLARQREGELTADEKPELWMLMRVYERALLRRSEALVEAVKRGLRKPLNGN